MNTSWGRAILWMGALVCACSGDKFDKGAGASTDSRQALAGSSFEGADGNLVVDTGGATDWVNAPNFASKTDLVKGQGDDTFAGGVKEDNTPKFTIDAIPPHKTDLTRFYVGSDTTSSPDVFLYLGWERTADYGDVNLDFEFNQGTPSPGQLVPNRSAGDILVTYDFAGNGAVQLGLLTWLTTAPADPSKGCFAHLDQNGNPVVSGSPPCWGNRIDLTKAGYAEGAVNGTTVVDPQNGGASLAPHLFGEAAIDLTAAGVIPPGTCKAFHTSTAHSRSSAAFDSSLQDFVGPLGVNINTCKPATIQLKKTAMDGVTPLAGAVLQLFYDANNDGVIETGEPKIGECTTGADGIGNCSFDVNADGKYIGHEATPPPGYTAAPDPAPVNVTLTSTTQTITILFEDNVVPGSIDVHKKDDVNAPVQGAVFKLYRDNAPTGGTPGIDPAGASEDLDAIDTCTTNATGDCTFGGLLPGAYWVVETSAPKGYKLPAQPYQHVDLPLGSQPGVGATASVELINPRVFKIVVLVCKEDGTLYPSTIEVDGLGPQTSLSSAQAAAAGLSDGTLCNIDQAGFGDRPAGDHSGTMKIQ